MFDKFTSNRDVDCKMASGPLLREMHGFCGDSDQMRISIEFSNDRMDFLGEEFELFCNTLSHASNINRQNNSNQNKNKMKDENINGWIDLLENKIRNSNEKTKQKVKEKEKAPSIGSARARRMVSIAQAKGNNNDNMAKKEMNSKHFGNVSHLDAGMIFSFAFITIKIN